MKKKRELKGTKESVGKKGKKFIEELRFKTIFKRKKPTRKNKQ